MKSYSFLYDYVYLYIQLNVKVEMFAFIKSPNENVRLPHLDIFQHIFMLMFTYIVKNRPY